MGIVHLLAIVCFYQAELSESGSEWADRAGKKRLFAAMHGGLKTGGFQTGYCNLEKSALYFICKRGDFTLLKPKQNKKRVLF